MIYFDYAATTPIDPSVRQEMIDCMLDDNLFANPASEHMLGLQARQAVESARSKIAKLINCGKKEIIFTSGATESNNLAIKSIAEYCGQKGRHIITCSTEHKAVLDPCSQLSNQGYEVTVLAPQSNGLINIQDFKSALREDTILVSLMLVNNETGVIHPLEEIGRILEEHQATFHIDAAQAVGKIPVDVQKLRADLLSLSGHKMYGPKGIGALYVAASSGLRLPAQIHGGGHERGMRSGTLATHQIVGLGAAAARCSQTIQESLRYLEDLRGYFCSGLEKITTIKHNVTTKKVYPGIVNVSFPHATDKIITNIISDLAVSQGSACNSYSIQSSYVLRALGLNDELTQKSIRFSFGRFTTREEIDAALELIKGYFSQ